MPYIGVIPFGTPGAPSGGTSTSTTTVVVPIVPSTATPRQWVRVAVPVASVRFKQVYPQSPAQNAIEVTVVPRIYTEYPGWYVATANDLYLLSRMTEV